MSLSLSPKKFSQTAGSSGLLSVLKNVYSGSILISNGELFSSMVIAVSALSINRSTVVVPAIVFTRTGIRRENGVCVF